MTRAELQEMREMVDAVLGEIQAATERVEEWESVTNRTWNLARQGFEREYYRHQLLATEGRISEVATRSKFSREGLYNKLKELELDPKDFRGDRFKAQIEEDTWIRLRRAEGRLKRLREKILVGCFIRGESA